MEVHGSPDFRPLPESKVTLCGFVAPAMVQQRKVVRSDEEPRPAKLGATHTYWQYRCGRCRFWQPGPAGGPAARWSVRNPGKHGVVRGGRSKRWGLMRLDRDGSRARISPSFDRQNGRGRMTVDRRDGRADCKRPGQAVLAGARRPTLRPAQPGPARS